MKLLQRTALVTFSLLYAAALAQAPAIHHVEPAKTGYFTAGAPPDLSELVPPPPAQDSNATRADLTELHQIEESRTPAEVAAAKADEKQENMFYLRTVMGNMFTPENLPLLAALSDHIKSEQKVAADELKDEFQRPRPYQADHTLHPVCGTTLEHKSYPSGHSITAYLEAFTLAEIVPERSQEILKRADDFAHNRLVCGVHYPSDVAAGRDVAYAVFGYLMAQPRFQSDMEAARVETRKRLGLGIGEKPTND
jgi:acid phosphatase (class A)